MMIAGSNEYAYLARSADGDSSLEVNGICVLA